MSGQLELRLGVQKVTPRRRCHSGAGRAKWWFERMRRQVDHTRDGEQECGRVETTVRGGQSETLFNRQV